MNERIGKLLCFFGLHDWVRFPSKSPEIHYRLCKRCSRKEKVSALGIMTSSEQVSEIPNIFDE